MDNIEEKIYAMLCKGCPNEKRCHDECDHCDDYYEVLENENRTE